MMNIPILGKDKTQEQIMAEKIAMQRMIQSLPVLTCPKCGKVHFQLVFLLRVQSSVLGGNDQSVIPDQTYMCINCNHVLGEDVHDTETPEPDPLNESNPASCDGDNQPTPSVPKEEDQNEDDEPDDKPGLSLV